MAERPFQLFIDLVQFDQKIHALETEIAQINQELLEISQQEDQLKKELADAKEKVVQLKKEVDAQELEMKSLDVQEKEKKQLLETISNYKEYQSLKTEIENVQQLQLKQEQAVLDAWNQLESAQAFLEKKEKEVEERLQDLQKSVREKKEKLESIKAEHKQLENARPEKEASVPDEWLKKYGAMRARVSDPVVPIEHESCSACFHLVTSQEIIRAKRGGLVQCKNCYRLLFVPEAMESGE